MESIESIYERSSELKKEKDSKKSRYNIYGQTEIRRALERENIDLDKVNAFCPTYKEKFVNVGSSHFAKDEEFDKYFAIDAKIDVQTLIGKFPTVEAYMHFLEYHTKPSLYYSNNMEEIRKMSIRSRGGVNNYWVLMSIPLIILLGSSEEAKKALLATGDKTFIAVNGRKSFGAKADSDLFTKYMSKRYLDKKLIRYCAILEIFRNMLKNNEFNNENIDEFIESNMTKNTTLLDGIE